MLCNVVNEKNVFEVDFNIFYLVYVQSTNTEGAGFMNRTAAIHQGAIKSLWLHSLWFLQQTDPENLW